MRLYDYQKTGRDFLKARRYALLADDQGIGKTIQAVAAAEELNLKNVLVICPASVKYTWQNEIRKWYPHATTFIVSSGKDKLAPAKYTIINYDLIHSRKIFLQLIYKHYDLIICDEAHNIKNWDARRTKTIYAPKGFKDRTDRLWLLTGTPVLNAPVEVFTHIRALVPEKLKHYVSYIAFTKHFCEGSYQEVQREIKRNGVVIRPSKTKWYDKGASNIEELAGILDSFMLRRLKKDVLKELPEKIYQNIVFEGNKNLIQKEREEYEREKNGVLGMLASCRRESGIAKVPDVVSHIQDVLENKQKAVVFAYHRDVISALMAGLGSYSPVVLTGSTPTDKRQKAVETFRKDNGCRVFIGQIEAAGTGIDGLQDVCDTVIFAEMSWVPGQIHQAIDRCHRIGQKNAVLVQFLITEGSIDEDIANTVAQKEKVIGKLVRPTTKEEPEMSMENELKRIADALERIADAKAVPAAVTPTATSYAEAVEVDAGKPVAKRKSAKAVPEVQVDAVPAPKSAISTGPELMAYCNTKLVGIKDPAERSTTIKAVIKMFADKYGVKAIKELEEDKIASAKADFDKLVGGGA